MYFYILLHLGSGYFLIDPINTIHCCGQITMNLVYLVFKRSGRVIVALQQMKTLSSVISRREEITFR
jgi:hypothetical protein